MTKNADFGPNLAVFGPKSLTFMGVSKSFGTNITENHFAEVSQVLDKWDEQTHSTKSKGWAAIDKSINSGLDRVTYYFRKSDPELVAQVYKDDIEFGHYVYGNSGY